MSLPVKENSLTRNDCHIHKHADTCLQNKGKAKTKMKNANRIEKQKKNTQINKRKYYHYGTSEPERNASFENPLFFSSQQFQTGKKSQR